ncbi:diaminopimelate decarboxylase [Deinococcus piscis]|uniref:Diaminopimelate decarboxylase n=1 Tax=Deinococcus piscis TaxID=394230 RepID=A0ABQ3K5F3_9DEIO|nr:diaminopimelate decarboxylase [Deinococcus piscis]GHG03699.1 diaminopimelate decarboxylase [Deinococcus piscis]
MHLPGTARVTPSGELAIGGVTAAALAERFGTPLFVYDEALIREQCRRFHRALQATGLDYQVSYASKAFLCRALARLMAEEGMGLDVVSGGELYTALSAGFNPAHIHLHGNNKLDTELRQALDAGVGCYVVDSLDEIARLNTLAGEAGTQARCLLRVTPGVEAHTHSFIQTGAEDSKFGLNLGNGQAAQGLRAMLDAPHLDVLGIHFHIGSQIFSTEGTLAALARVLEWLAQQRADYGFTAQVLNVGGGFGIRYTDADQPQPLEDALAEIAAALRAGTAEHDLPLPQLWLEPGRSVVGEAGWTLYRVGTVKAIAGVRNYVSVDGGMSDHIRTALYGAEYEVALANRMDEAAADSYTVVGKLCESGDVVARDKPLPHPQPGDLLAVSCTGAYHYAMSSRYNAMLRPAVVFVQDGQAREVVRRETLEDLVRGQE